MSLLGSPLASLPTLRSARSRRVSSWDRSGGNSDFIVAEEHTRSVWPCHPRWRPGQRPVLRALEYTWRCARLGLSDPRPGLAQSQ